MVVVVPALAEGEQRDDTLFRESSRVLKRRVPHICVMEFTVQVACKPKASRKQVAHSSIGRPPMTNNRIETTTIGIQW